MTKIDPPLTLLTQELIGGGTGHNPGLDNKVHPRPSYLTLTVQMLPALLPPLPLVDFPASGLPDLVLALPSQHLHRHRGVLLPRGLQADGLHYQKRRPHLNPLQSKLPKALPSSVNLLLDSQV